MLIILSDSTLGCVSSSPLRSRYQDEIRCPRDLLDETLLKNKEEGDRKRGRAFRLRCRSDPWGRKKEEGLTGESLKLQHRAKEALGSPTGSL